ncbi:hypothetical protein POSPLADRAFT_1062676 [Postia placenta MAD-698-R-SB12]|uniref:Uncharacterized protein n=1 Tax=Postia placenta MAD-698-R-SB12 TaxID=670580 RepID=A0A1X6MJI1_9APHY|nr:hypothetical protein POSPLADRAFT_1062676 [Postia placenta MAD-698-R-SB12]OSX56530.1 hypothetical protein POSPLADRAFT_1062676 [Postia placenta MAD-698-R-SB12]
MVFTVTDIGPEDVIIGLDWLCKHNPEIDWETGSLKLSQCPEMCGARKAGQMEQAATAHDMGVRPTVLPDFEPKEDPKEIEWDETNLIEAWEQGIMLPGTPQLFVAAGHTLS